MNIKIILILFLITLSGGFLRFYKLDKYPVQLNHDEISQIYDVASIVQTGKDIYGNFLPLAFPSTGDFKIGHYIYLTVIPYLIFGMREITVRIPAAFFGTLIIPAVFLFVNQLCRNWKLSLISAAVIAVTPSQIFYSRKSFESVIGIFFMFLGLHSLLKELEDGRKHRLFITAFLLALPMYIYTSFTLTMPLIIVGFVLNFWKDIRTVLKKFFMILTIWIIFISPLFYITLTNPDIRFRAASVSVFQDANLGRQLQNAETDNSVFKTIYQLKIILDYSFTKYLRQFDPSFIFGNGLDFTNQGMLDIGPLMFLQLPFFLIGLIYIIKSERLLIKGRFLFILLLMAMIPSGFTFEEFSPHRSVLSFSIMSIISAFGIYWSLHFIQKKLNLAFRIGIIWISGLLLIFNFVYLVHMYTVNYPYEKSQSIHFPYKQAALFTWSEYPNFEHIIVDPMYGQSAPVRAVAVHYYLAYYGYYPPSKFQKDLKVTETGINFDKFEVREINWRKDQFLKNTLIIASPWSIPLGNIDKNKVIKRFDFYDGQPAFYALGL